jgi:RNA polymerase sigma-54 factor
MGQTMELRLRQHLTLTPQLQQALRLLQLSSLDFEQEMREALDTNPFLEEEDTAAKPAGEEGSANAEGMEEQPVVSASEIDASADSERADSGVGLDDLPRSAASHDGEDGDWTEWSEAQPTLGGHLKEQLLISQMGERDRALAQLVIDALDDDGYLKLTFEELAGVVLEEHDVQPDDFAASLRLVQTLDPPGVGARSLQECLMLQLQALPETATGRAVALALVGEHFALLAAREFVRLQQLIGCSDSDLHVARTLIRTLDPRPGRRFGPDDTRYVAADVIVSKVRGKWNAAINPAVLPRIRINRAYADLAGSRASGGAQMSRQLQEARWLIRNMEQRFVTIHRVAEAIVAKQRNFFEYGDVAMKPLALKQIATELGLHESTVCRVTNGKYMATPRGLFEFKRFFSRQLATENGGSCSATAIRALMKELIAAEPPQDPLSDAQLTKLLAGQGLRVARRTVTKYRTLMRLPSVELRRARVHAAAAA